MQTSISQLLFGADTLVGNWIEECLPPAFAQVVHSLQGNCGVLVLSSVQPEEGFWEVASVGYEEEGFFYSFMVSDSDAFAKVKASEHPVVYLKRDVQLYHPDSNLAVVSRISKGTRMLGFLLVEFAGEWQELPTTLLGLFATRLATLYQNKVMPVFERPQHSPANSLGSVMQLLVESFPGFLQMVEQNIVKTAVLIRGKRGVGKKSLARFLHKKLALEGDIIILNTIPEQLVKLERALRDWCEMVGNGVIVFENSEAWSLAQQRFFYEYVWRQKQVRFYFLQRDALPQVEFYAPLYKKLEAAAITVPSLNSLETALLQQVIVELAKEVFAANGKAKFRIETDAVAILASHYYKENLIELRSILEHSVLHATQGSLKAEGLVIENDSHLKSLGVSDAEDLDLRKSVESLERQKIMLANKLFAGNQVRMAKALGISRGSLQYKMKQMELQNGR
ncbi:MAG: helix-turn-helix domain-containing protein [Spirochaetota bacterium]